MPDVIALPPPARVGKLRGLVTLIAGVAIGAGTIGGLMFVTPSLFVLPGSSKHEAAPEEAEAPAYYPLQQAFTSNLRDSDAFVQISLSLAAKSPATIEAIKVHEAAVRSAILMALADRTVEEVDSAAGKVRLAVILRNAINKSLRQRAAKGDVDGVFFTSFVVQ